MSVSKLSSRLNKDTPVHKPSHLRDFAARAAHTARSENAKLGVITVAVIGICLGIHTMQVMITKKVLLG